MSLATRITAAFQAVGADIKALYSAAAGKEPTISAGTTEDYLRGDKTWQGLAGAVRASVMTGLSTATSTAVVAADTLLAAIGKLQAQITLRAPIASPTLTGTPLAPTAAVGTSNTQIATTAFVNAEISNDAPSKTGAGASGTWPISITGSAAGNQPLNAALTAIAANPSAFVVARADLAGAANIDTLQINGPCSLALCTGTKPLFETEGTILHYQYNTAGDAYQECLGLTGLRRYRYRAGAVWGVWDTVVTSTNAQLIYGSCSFNGTGTPAFLVNTAGFNSVSKSATGTYLVTGVFGSLGVNAPIAATSTGLGTKVSAAPGASSVTIITSGPTSATNTDSAFVSVIVGKVS